MISRVRLHCLLRCSTVTPLSVVKFCKCAHLLSSVVYTLVIQPQSVMPIRICELGLVVCTLLFSLTQYHLITKQKADYAAIVIKGCHILNKSQLLRVGILKFWWLTITYWISIREFPARHNYIILHYQGEIAIDQKCSNLRYKIHLSLLMACLRFRALADVYVSSQATEVPW